MTMQILEVRNDIVKYSVKDTVNAARECFMPLDRLEQVIAEHWEPYQYYGWFSAAAAKHSGYCKYLNNDGKVVKVTLVSLDRNTVYGRKIKYVGAVSKYLSGSIKKQMHG